MIKRFDRLDIATADLPDAASIYERNFGFAVSPASDPDTATITLGDAHIRLLAGAPAAGTIAESGEGLAAIWFEANDLDEVEEALRRGGIAFAPIRRIGDRRVLTVDQKSASMTPLYIFDRRV